MTPPTDAERLDAAIDAVERELGRRREAKWKAGEYKIPVRIVDPSTVGLEVALPQSLEFPPELLEIHIVDPAPQVELPGEQWGQPDAVDVTPPPWRPPASPPPSSARSLPPAPGAGALSVDPARMNIPARIHDAEQRRTRRFQDDEWGSPAEHPLRYPRGNRSGW